MTIHKSRDVYRCRINKEKFKPFRVVVKETDLFIHAKKDFTPVAVESVLKYRGYIESYIRQYPDFVKTLLPWVPPGPCHDVIGEMVQASEKAGVGPMAAVAGVIAEYVGRDLVRYTDEIIVENGGDVFIHTRDPVTVGVYAGNSPLSLKVGIRVPPHAGPTSLCTSAGTFGHSLSMGKADAVCVKSGSCALSDAVATATGNRVRRKSDIHHAIAFGKKIEGVAGLLVIVEDAMGVWGDMELVPLKGKKP